MLGLAGDAGFWDHWGVCHLGKAVHSLHLRDGSALVSEIACGIISRGLQILCGFRPLFFFFFNPIGAPDSSPCVNGRKT